MPFYNTPRTGQPIRARDIGAIAATLNADPVPLGGKPTFINLPSLVASIDNLSGAPLLPASAIVITGQALSGNPETNRQIVLNARIAQEGDDLTRLVVTLRDIPAGQVGKAILSGLAWVQYNTGTSGSFLTPVLGTVIADLGSSGPAQVLATQGGFALVRFPVGAGGGGGLATAVQWRAVHNEGVA